MDFGCISNGNAVLTRLTFDDGEIWHSVVGLLATAMLFYSMAYTMLRFVSRHRYLPITSI